MKQYVSDNDGRYPGGGLRGSSWTVGIFPYLKNDAVFNCPSEEHTDNAFKNGQLIGGQRPDYDYNLVQFGELNRAKWSGANESKHAPVDTSRLMMILEDSDYGSDYVEEVPLPCGKMSHKDDVYGFTTRHSGGSNVAFADGHVKWLTPQVAAANYCDTEGIFPRSANPELPRP